MKDKILNWFKKLVENTPQLIGNKYIKYIAFYLIKDDKVLYDGVLYKVLQNHTSQEGWTPTSAPSLFVKVLTSEGEILDWEQPSSTNPYMKGDKVKYNGKVYESLIDNNVWSPDGYPVGWKLIEE